jgi:hypothetical protein
MSHEHSHQWDIESYRSLAETGKLAQNALLLVGGGASAALLSFIGVLAGKDGNEVVVSSLMAALSWFFGALLLTVALSGTAYLAQAFYKAQAFAHSDMAAAAGRQDASALAVAQTEAAEAEKRGNVASGLTTGLFVLAFVFLIIGGTIALTAGSTFTRQADGAKTRTSSNPVRGNCIRPSLPDTNPALSQP